MLALLDRNPLLRRVGPALVAAVGLVVFTQLVLPGTPGGGRGTPMAILFLGAVRGLVVALTAVGVVLLYRTLRIINFAQAALGIAGGVLCFALVQFTPVPFPLAFLLGLALSAVIGGGVGLFTLRFLQAPRLVLTVFTILLAAVVASFAGQVRQLPFLPDQAELSIADQLGADQVDAFLPFPGFTFTIGDTPLSFGFAEVFAIEMAIIALCALGAFFRFTRAGVAVRALAENAERASLLGIGVGALSCAVWAIAGALSGAGVMLTGALVTPGSATGFAPGLLLPALAAAVIGRFTSLPVTIAAAVGIGVASAAADWSLTNERQSLVEVGLFAVVVVGLLVQRKGLQRSESSGGSSWQASDEQRPIPAELAGIRGLRLARRAAIGVGLAAVLLYPFVVSSGAQSLGGVIALSAIVVLSLVVLTGWAG
ncbi:MAG: branched-chain amino acid ABC transporter permease, partial [Actinomycetota bacterium]|nr:branched-chain amino acid ABC transporter permease [Actinomycetota bacterium]